MKTTAFCFSLADMDKAHTRPPWC